MESRAYRRLVALSEIRRRPDISQRALGRRVKVSLGLANALLREFESEGLVSVRSEPDADGARYALTAHGRNELVRLGEALLGESADLLHPLREELVQAAERLQERGIRKVVLCASGVAADLAAAALRDGGVRVLSVAAEDAPKTKKVSCDAAVVLSDDGACAAKSLFGRRTKIVRLAPRPAPGGRRRG